MSDLISWLAGSNTLTPNPGFRCSLYRGTAYPIDRRPQSEVHVRPDKLEVVIGVNCTGEQPTLLTEDSRVKSMPDLISWRWL